MTPPQPEKLIVPAGMVALTTWGLITVETTASLTELVRFNERAGIKDIAYTFVSGGLVDKSRNEAAKQMLATQINGQPLQWLVFLDSDATFAPNVLDQLLATAYQATPWADIVGAWCPLRGKPYLPTIDTGSGTWEPHDVGCGVLEVIRTGAHCILIKRHVFEKMSYPWYGVRPAPRAIDVLTEMDNFARCHMDGQNPLRNSPAWAALEKCAVEEAVQQRARMPQAGRGDFISAVGEDSNLCDKARALGFRIVVDTNIVTGHVDRRVITHIDHMQALKEIRDNQKLIHGIVQ
jgi:hypothetical protein